MSWNCLRNSSFHSSAQKITSSIRLLPIKPSHLCVPCSEVKPVLPEKDFFLSPQTSGESKAVLHCISLFLARRKEGEKHTFSGLGLSSSAAPHTVCCRESCAVAGNCFSRVEVRIAQRQSLASGFAALWKSVSSFHSQSWPGSGPSSQLSPCAAPPARWVLTFLHGWHCPIPLPQCAGPWKVKILPSATLHGNTPAWILQLTVLSSSGAGAWGLKALHPSELCLGEGFRLLLCLELHNTTALATGCCVYRQWDVLITGCSLPPALSTY